MKKQSGFTLIELMIVVAIVAILAAIALPAYQSYTLKSRFTEVVSAVGPMKSAVEVCYQTNNGDLTACANGTNGVPANVGASGNVTSVTWLPSSASAGVITATGTAAAFSSATYTLTASGANGQIIWTASGSCKTTAMC